jgi:hypothetical protein
MLAVSNPWRDVCRIKSRNKIENAMLTFPCLMVARNVRGWFCMTWRVAVMSYSLVAGPQWYGWSTKFEHECAV